MLDNNYLNLYNIDFYNMRMYFLPKEDVEDFQTLFSYVNVLYIESKKCIEIIGDEIKIVGESNIIYSILEDNPSIISMLKEVSNVEKITYTGHKKTYLDAAVMVCEEHLNKINNKVHK